MKVIAHKCPNCGAHIDIKENTTKGKCDFCRVSYTIDDGIIRIEHTIKVSDDTQLRVAEATLYKFKEYDESEILFRRILHKHGDLPNVYIGLILSITHDFTINTGSLFDIANIAEYWERFVALASDKDIQKYESNFKKYCANFWSSKLKSITDNFTDYKCDESVASLDAYILNYSLYVSDSEFNKLNQKYESFKIKKIDYDKKKKNFKIFLIIGFILLFIIVTILFNILLSSDKPKVNGETVYTSEMLENDYCNKKYECNSYDFLLNHLNAKFSLLNIENVFMNKEKHQISFTVILKNLKKEEKYDYTFDIKDDIGPFIVDNNCVFSDTDDVNIYECFSIESFDKFEVNKDNFEFDISNIDFKNIGRKSLLVKYNYDGKTISNTIDIQIIKSEIEFNFEIKPNYVEINKAISYKYSFDKDIPNKDLKFEYDKKYISIDTKNNKIAGIKEGTSRVCATSMYDESKTYCIDITVLPTCKSTYVFNYDGLTKSNILSGKDICPGIYKLYVSVVDKNQYYYLKILNDRNFTDESIYINKAHPSINDEGKKYSIPIKYSLEVPIGINQVKLIKQ